MTLNKLGYAGVAVLMLLTARYTQAVTASQDAEQLLQHLINAAKAGNTNDYLADLTADSRQTITAAQSGQAALEAAHSQFRAALDQRFGKGPALQGALLRDDLRTVITRLYAVEALSTKEISSETIQVVARIQIKTDAGKITSSEQTLTLKQEHGGWKLQAPLPPKDSYYAASAISACERTTKALREGRFKDRASAMVALDQALAQRKEAK